MKEERDYGRDISEIRSMMERSSKFLSLSGWAGVMAGIYALAGAWIAYGYYGFNPGKIAYGSTGPEHFQQVAALAVSILVLAVGTAVALSYRNARKRGETAWNATSRRLLTHMGVPLAAGGFVIVIFSLEGLIGLIAPFTLLFYGLALYNASKFTFDDLKVLGLIQVGLGLLGCWFVAYGLLLWAIGFGGVHIIYGIYLHYKYER